MEIPGQLLLHLLLLFEHASGIFQLFRIAGDQACQFSLGCLPQIDGRWLLAQGGELILNLAENAKQRERLQLGDLLVQRVEFKLQRGQ